MSMKVIQEVKKIGTKKFAKTVGVEMTLLDLIEQAEYQADCFDDDLNGESFCVGTVQYTVTVKGKDVNAEDVHITLEDDEDNKPSYFYSEDGDELGDLEVSELEVLNTLSKADLINKILEARE